jgi:integrase
LARRQEVGLKDARDLARKAHVQAAGGIDPGEAKTARRQAAKQAVRAPKDIIETIAAQFMARHVKGLAPSSQREVTRVIDRDVLPAWRERRLSQISKSDVHDLLDAIVDRGAPVYANRVLAWLKGLANFAVQRGALDVSPFTGISSPTTETARDRVLSDDELLAIWLASDSLEIQHSAFVKLLILTGQRRNEISGMCWHELDLDAGFWTLPAARAKNGREHKIPLADSSVAIIRALPRITGSDFVLTFSGRVPMRGHFAAKKRIDALLSNMEPWVFHDLRRTFASGCARLGIAIHVVEALLNHRSGVISGIGAVYNRYSYDTEKRSAAVAWSRFVEALVSSEALSNVRYITKG